MPAGVPVASRPVDCRASTLPSVQRELSPVQLSIQLPLVALTTHRVTSIVSLCTQGTVPLSTQCQRQQRVPLGGTPPAQTHRAAGEKAPVHGVSFVRKSLLAEAHRVDDRCRYLEVVLEADPVRDVDDVDHEIAAIGPVE